MDLHPLHRSTQPTASQPQQGGVSNGSNNSSSEEPLEYTVKRLSQEIEALKVTAQYSQAKALKYKMMLQEAPRKECDSIEEYKAHVHALMGNEQIVLSKLEKKKGQIRAYKASEKETGVKTEEYKAQIRDLQDTAGKVEKYKAYIRELRAREEKTAEELGKYAAYVSELRANEEDCSDKLGQYATYVQEVQAWHHHTNSAQCGAQQMGSSENEVSQEIKIRELMDNEQVVRTKLAQYREYIRELKSRNNGNSGNEEETQQKLKAFARKYKEAVVECEQQHANFIAVSNELGGIKAELPHVKQLLREGGQATRKLQTLTVEAQERISALRHKLVETRTRALEGETLARSKEEELRSDATAAQTKLKAAVHEAQVHAQRVQACAEMLAKTHMVLHTCSQYHTNSQEGSELAGALEETTNNVASFLQTLAPADPMHGSSSTL